jgi:hypothetical protein
MSVPNQTPYIVYTANGMTTVFPFEFYIISASDIQVTINGVLVTTGYTVFGAGNVNGGDVIFLTPPANGSVVMLERVVPTYRLTEYQDNGDLLADTVNKDFDRIWMAIQRAFIGLGLALTRPFLGGPFNAKNYRIENLGDPVNSTDAVNNRTMRNYVDAAIAGVVGGYGWFIQYGVGAVYRTFQEKMRDEVNALDFVPREHREAVLNFQVDGTQWLKNAINSGASLITIPSGKWMLSQSIEIPPGVQLIGQGIDDWYTYTPDASSLPRSWDKGTHLVFVGSGAKNKTFANISNERPVKTVNGVVCGFTKFTNEDSTGTTPATLKSFSVAVTATHSSQIKNLRIMLSNDGITGYNNGSASLGDDWDIGLHVFNGLDIKVSNVQVCGYWRVAGTLITENDGSLTSLGNPERMHFDKFFTQGVRGLLIRNCPQIDVVSNTTNSVTFKHVPSLRITAGNTFKIPGNSGLFTFTGSSSDGTNVTLTGVTPSLPASLGVIRYPSVGNNLSGTNFENAYAGSLDHATGQASETLGLPVSFALEIDGFPLRNPKFHNFKAQTIYDKGCALIGDTRDAKFINCEFENGRLIAYDISETQGYTGNLRLINTDVQTSVDISGFNPRDCFVDYRQFPTQQTNGDFFIQNWRPKHLRIRWSTGQDHRFMRETAGSSGLGGWSDYTLDGTQIFDVNGQTKNILFNANNGGINFTDGSSVISWFGNSGTVNFKGIIAPMVDNSKSNGTAPFRWSQIYAATGTINTSDEREKSKPAPITDAVLDAWGDVSVIAFQWLNMIAEKGDDARWHFGVIAQQVRDAFESHGIDGTKFGLLCYDEWDDVYEPVTEIRDVVIREEVSEGEWVERVVKETHETGEQRLVLAAGNRWGVRPDQCAWIEAAYQRRRCDRIEERLSKLES